MSYNTLSQARLEKDFVSRGHTSRAWKDYGVAGTACDGQHLFQLAEDLLQKIDPKTGRVLTTIPAPGGGGDSGLTGCPPEWAFRGPSPMATICSSAEEQVAGR